MGKTIKDFDPAAFRAFVMSDRRDYLSFAGGITRCVFEMMNRRNLKMWTFSGLHADLKIKIAQGKMAFPEATVYEGRNPGPWAIDEEFKACYSAALRRLEFDCPGCRDGEITVPFPFQGKVFAQGKDPFDPSYRNPATDPGFSIQSE